MLINHRLAMSYQCRVAVKEENRIQHVAEKAFQVTTKKY